MRRLMFDAHTNPQKKHLEVRKNKDEVYFTNPDISPIKHFTCNIPFKVLEIMKSIENKLEDGPASNCEFSIYTYGKISNNILEISADYYIPEQVVGITSVDYLEDNKKFNGVIHKHPSSCKSFSSTDERFINGNYLFSILYVDFSFKTGIINLPTEYGRIRLPLDLNIIGGIDIPDNMINKIKHIPPPSLSSITAELVDSDNMFPGFGL